MDEFASTLGDTLRHLNVAADAAQLARLADHFDLLLEANSRFNLTRITEPAKAARMLYGDSAAVLAWAGQTDARIRTVLDVGSGAGFPAVPLAVLAPHWQVTALEARGKKAGFVRDATDRLGLGNLDVVHDHGAQWKTDRRFDLITFKAVGALEVCLTQAARYAAAGGQVAVFKTASIPEKETRAGEKAARRLGFEECSVWYYELPDPTEPARFGLRVYKRAASFSSRGAAKEDNASTRTTPRATPRGKPRAN